MPEVLKPLSPVTADFLVPWNPDIPQWETGEIEHLLPSPRSHTRDNV